MANKYPVPFFSQIPNWKGEASGFPSDELEKHWGPCGCGIACLRMAVNAFSNDTRALERSYWDWIELGIQRGAYCERGWIHDGIRDLAREAGVGSESFRAEELAFIFEKIEAGNLVMASVTLGFAGGITDGIMGEDKRKRDKGGHLALAIDIIDGELVFHHPSSRAPLNWVAKAIQRERVEASFSGNGVTFFKNDSS